MSGLLDVVTGHPFLAFGCALCLIAGSILVAVGIAVAGTERVK